MWAQLTFHLHIVKTVGIIQDLVYEWKYSDPGFIELGTMLRCTFGLRDLREFWKVQAGLLGQYQAHISTRICVHVMAVLHFSLECSVQYILHSQHY